MYASVFASLAALVAFGSSHSSGLPFVELGAHDLFGLPIQPFGIIVATGVLIGAEVMRRYALRRGVDEDDLRGLTGWVVVSGFIGAHLFDVLAYEHDRLGKDPLLLFKVWDGISSYGGFLGGAMGWWFYNWWKRLTPGLWADAIGLGLLLGFAIGRIGCTLVHDHIGRATDFFLGIDYPKGELEARRVLAEIQAHGHHAGSTIRCHNMAMYELMYLIPLNALILWLGFQRKRRLPAGLIAVLIVLFYTPVRFVLEFWRLNESDQRYVGLTFAQWVSILVAGVAAYAALQIIRRGRPAPLEAELGGMVGGRQVTLVALAKADAAAAKTDGAKGKTDVAKGKTDGGKGKADGGKGKADVAKGKADGGKGKTDGSKGKADGGKGKTDGGKDAAKTDGGKDAAKTADPTSAAKATEAEADATDEPPAADAPKPAGDDA